MNIRTALLSLLLGISAGCGRHESPRSTTPTALPAVAVRTIEVTAENLASATEVTGTVQAVQRAQLAARVMGAIEEMPVTLGQRVSAGDVLVRIAAGDISARVAQARTHLAALHRELERERGLQATGASARETVRGLEDRVSAAEAQLREAEALLDFTIIRAPFDGVIARKPANAGDLATPGAPLLEVHGLNQFEVEAAVPETAAAGLRVGDAVAVTIPTTGLSFVAKAAELSSAADVRARAITLKASVPAGVTLHSGQFARLRISGAGRPALLVPASAVTSVGQMERIFTVGDDRRATLRLVKTGGRHGDRFEVLAGLQAGDRVIVAPPGNLRDGQRVEETP
jgi:RND family efflux transporter MFP subunit